MLLALFFPFLTSKKPPYAGLMEVWPQILNVILKKQWQHLNIIYKKIFKINYSIPLLTHDNICLPTLGNRQQARIPTVTHTHLPAPPPPPPFFTIWRQHVLTPSIHEAIMLFHHKPIRKWSDIFCQTLSSMRQFIEKHFVNLTYIIWHTVEPSTLLQTHTQSLRES